MTLSVLEARERDAKAKALFYSGATDTHPHGLSGKRWVIPPECGQDCRDTSRAGWKFSEWGNAAGYDFPKDEI